MISVIIPALNEEAGLPRTLRRARATLSAKDEIIVVDGGSRDNTIAAAEYFGARVLTSERGRGRQMNAGAAAAKGDIFLFLHADTVLPPDASAHLHFALENPNVLGGNFRLQFDVPTYTARYFALIYNLRSRHDRIFYGDSAIWVRRDVFEALGGYQEAILMEDYRFCLQLREEAKRRATGRGWRSLLPLIDSPVITSARRFHGKEGLAWKMAATWSLLHVLYSWGASPEKLETRFYKPAR